jgi:hypothetical protein
MEHLAKQKLGSESIKQKLARIDYNDLTKEIRAMKFAPCAADIGHLVGQ